jgi:hypothetical protein
MQSIFIADVGDGLCMAIQTGRGLIHIDCGSQQGGHVAYAAYRKILRWSKGKDIFVLTHFHQDHYNGLLHLASSLHRYKYRASIEQVYFPRIPDIIIDEKLRSKLKLVSDLNLGSELARALLSMSMRVFGNKSGVMEFDFLESINQINEQSGNFHYKAVHQGDRIFLGDTRLEVLWPPRKIRNNRIVSILAKAIKDFKRAREQDDLTNRLYEQIVREGTSEKLFSEREPYYTPEKHDKSQKIEKQFRDLPPAVKKANESLREAANQISLVLKSTDSSFLSLGDIEESEIKEVIKQLCCYGHNYSSEYQDPMPCSIFDGYCYLRKPICESDLGYHCTEKSEKNYHKIHEHFDVILTPHHGTHWDNSLKYLKSNYCISSVGKKLFGQVSKQFEDMPGRMSLTTKSNGNILLNKPQDFRGLGKVASFEL